MMWPSFKQHCTLAFLLRIILICYANFHDKHFPVPYTDIDYKVYTDAAKYLTLGESPYKRHTYRYSPLLALILTPNIFLHVDFGKIFFSAIDIITAILIKSILSNSSSQKISAICGISWLYNPITVVISTRGNADSLIVILVLLTLYLINKHNFITGLIYGLSVHFRLYPIIFSLVMYLSLRGSNYIIPNKNQLKFIFGFILSFGCFTAISYHYFGYEFLYESFIYHLIRKDARHNFSLYFYMLYLSVDQPLNIIERIVRTILPLILFIAVSFRYPNKKDLPFALLIQSLVMVTYNSVVTSQYLFWYLSLLPLCVPHIHMSLMRYLLLGSFWVVAQGLWLFDAYCLEFLGLNKFNSIWIDSIIFFLINIKIIQYFIVYYENRCKNK